MGPNVCDLISHLYYNDQLHSSAGADLRILHRDEYYHDVYAPLMIYHAVSSEEQRRSGGNISLLNRQQVYHIFYKIDLEIYVKTVMVREVIEAVKQFTNGKTIMVVCAYRAQLEEIRFVVDQHRFQNVAVETVDSSQVYIFIS